MDGQEIFTCMVTKGWKRNISASQIPNLKRKKFQRKSNLIARAKNEKDISREEEESIFGISSFSTAAVTQTTTTKFFLQSAKKGEAVQRNEKKCLDVHVCVC